MIGFLVLIATILVIIAAWFITKEGIKLCNENNAWGVFLLFIPLNLLGIFIGIIIMYNWRQKHYFKDKN